MNDKLANLVDTYPQLIKIIKRGFLESVVENDLVQALSPMQSFGIPDDGNGGPQDGGEGFEITLRDGSKVRLMLFQLFE